MKTVTSAFTLAQGKGSLKAKRQVYYKRRYWSSTAFIWETSWTLLPETEVVNVSPITGKLDTDKLNEFKISNLTLVLANDVNQWKPDNRAGYFGPTTTVPQGFEPHWTKFQVKLGLELASGAYEYVTVFVGMLTDFQTEANGGTVDFTIQGLECLLTNTDAENVSTTVSKETATGTVNGSNKDFTTTSPGVGVIDEVSVDYVAKQPGKDYTVSQLNDTALGAKISFLVAPSSGTVRISYRYWKQDEVIEDLVKDLLTQAGIPGAAQIVDPVIFPVTITNLFTQDSAADWAAGTGTKTDVARSLGNVATNAGQIDQYQTLDTFATLDSWTQYNNNGYKNYSAQLGYLCVHGVGSGIYQGATKTVGAWHLSVYTTIPGTYNVWNIAYAFMAGGHTTVSGDAKPISGYALRISKAYGTGGSTDLTVAIERWNGSGVSTTLLTTTVNFAASSGWKPIIVTRDRAGTFSLTVNGVAKGTVSDTAYTASTEMGFYTISASIADTDAVADILSDPKPDITASFVSQYLDVGSTPTSWGRLSATQTLSGAAIAYSTRTSADHSTWDDYVVVAGNGQIGSALKRYIEFKADYTLTNIQTQDPMIDKVTIEYSTSTTPIALANFTGQSAYDSIQSLASFANYEWGFASDETFFFRSKTATKDVDLALDSRTNLMTLSSLVPGVDNVYSEVEATYGTFTVILKDTTSSPYAPTKRYGKKRLTVDGGDLLIAPDTDVATGVAQLFFRDIQLPKRRAKARTILLPQADLSDTVSVTFFDVQPAPQWYWGDPTAYWGRLDLFYQGYAQQTANGLIMKIVGYRHDFENHTSEFDLEEIL